MEEPTTPQQQTVEPSPSRLPTSPKQQLPLAKTPPSSSSPPKSSVTTSSTTTTSLHQQPPSVPSPSVPLSASKSLHSHIAAALKMSTTTAVTTSGAVESTPLIVGLISNPGNKPHGGGGGVVVTKTGAVSVTPKVSTASVSGEQQQYLSGSQVVKISAAANPSVIGSGGGLQGKLSNAGGGQVKSNAGGSVSLGKFPKAPPGGHVPSGKPKAFLAMMAASEGGVMAASSGAGTGRKQTAKKAQAPKSGVTSKSSKIKSLPSASSVVGVVDHAPSSRVSQRSIKRPRTYDDEMEGETPPTGGGGGRAGASKKTKLNPKATKGGQKNIPRPSGAVKDLGRWRPTDDLMLISAVQQTNDLSAVHLGVKFSCRFTLREVEERWYALLYDPQISKIAVEAMRSLHPGVVTMALNNALWSQEEEAVLAKIPSTDPGHLEKFQSLLKDNPAVFHTCRTATSLHHHWVLMGHYTLLDNQKVDLIPPSDSITKFSDAQDRLKDTELIKPRDVKEEALEQELVAADRLAKREILKLEAELPSWRTVIDTASLPELCPDEYAVLKGRVVEYRMTKHSVTLGRATPTNEVDFDLSLEGPSFKISRKQATLHLSEEGELLLTNDGRRPLFVDGKALITGKSTKITNNQLLEVASLSFLILVNSDLSAR